MDRIRPAYYRKGKIDVIDFCMELNIPFAEGNVIKYIVRHREKNGIEDLKKAVEYINRIAQKEYGQTIVNLETNG